MGEECRGERDPGSDVEMLSPLREIVPRIAGKKILVVGDIMLDTYIFGTAERLSPEAPVPVVPVQERLYSPGGAANVVSNLKGLGADVTLAGLVGTDVDGDRLMEMLGPSPLIVRSSATTSKMRVVANGQHVVRVDQEEFPRLENCNALMGLLESVSEWFDWIILSDYCKGAVSDTVARWAVKTHSSQVSVDSKRKDLSVFAGCGVITPNVHEAKRILGIRIEGNEEAHHASRELLLRFDVGAVLLTRGKDGMVLAERNDPTGFFIPAIARNVFDVTGAGDTVIAVLSAALAAGATMLDAAILSGIAAGVVVEEVGTSAITRQKLLAAIHGTRRREFRPYSMGAAT